MQITEPSVLSNPYGAVGTSMTLRHKVNTPESYETKEIEEDTKSTKSNHQPQPQYKFDNIRVYWYDNRGGEDGVHKSEVFSKIVPSEEFYDSLGYVAKILVCERGVIKKYGLNNF